MESNPIFYNWSRGLRSVAGGTRSQIKLDRPWQKEIAVSTSCSLCHMESLAEFDYSGGWKLVKNQFTPYSFHQLLVTKTCWSMDKVRCLGGQEEIQAAFKIISLATDQSEISRLFVTVHVGALAGQNLNHLHYHLVDYSFGDSSESDTRNRLLDHAKKNPNLVILENNALLAVIGGLRAGQCFILPKSADSLVLASNTKLVSLIAGIVNLYNQRFCSTQGLPPDFSLALILRNSCLDYGLYTPILNHWGAAENIALYEPKIPITLPWSHEVTADYLKKRPKL